MNQSFKKYQQGFTLVEIAIVLVIVGLILGGVLKGQEMISNAKVRNVVDQTTAIQTAVFAFQDRFRALPGDYALASTNIAGVATGANGGNGNGNGFVSINNERGLFWMHLANSGYITGNYDGAAAANNLNCAAGRCPRNAFGGAMMFSWGSGATGTSPNAHELRFGRSIPVNVLSEIDRKVDDGIPEAGSLRTDNVNIATCRTGADATSVYNAAGGQQDCAGVRIM